MACLDEPTEAPDLTRQEAEQALTISPPTPPPEPPTPNAELVAIEITWDGVGALYKAFFQDQKRITQLSKDLAPWLEEPVQLFIHYDSEDFLGQIVVRVPPDGLRIQPRFDPSSGSLPEGQVMLSDLAPITTALATYRSGLSQS